MADYLKATNTYDLTKNVTGIEMNTGFILGLDSVLMYYITNIVKDPSTLSETFKKFEKIISNDFDPENPPVLDLIERQLYTLFAIQQLLKAKAKEQNLEIPLESKVTQEDVAEYIKNMMSDDTEAATKKLAEIEKLITKKSS